MFWEVFTLMADRLAYCGLSSYWMQSESDVQKQRDGRRDVWITRFHKFDVNVIVLLDDNIEK